MILVVLWAVDSCLILVWIAKVGRDNFYFGKIKRNERRRWWQSNGRMACTRKLTNSL